MARKTIQDKIEEETYSVINDIADEFNLSIPFYPEVYWVGNKFKFETLGLSEIEREDFESVKKFRISKYIYSPKIILIGNKNIGQISEEAGHFLHFVNSKLKYNNKNTKNLWALYSIIEMIGYFCSKLMDSGRKNRLKDYSDIIDEREKCMEEIGKWDVDIREFWVYQQGYGLGEILFNSYISGIISKNKIRNLFLQDFEKPNEALITFLKLKYKTLNY
jgi:hypothetical protein